MIVDGEKRTDRSDWSDVCSRVHHDLKAMARHMSQLSEWVETDLREDGVEVSETVRFSLDHIGHLGEQLKTYATGVDGFLRAGTSGPGSCNLNSALDLILPRDFGHEKMQLNRFIEVDEIPLPLSECSVLLSVLISNVFLHSGMKHAKLDIASKMDGSYVKILVRDYGIGMDSTDLDTAFLFGRRMSKDSDTKGIGLAVARRICDAYGGRITLLNAKKPAGLIANIYLQSPRIRTH